MPINQQDTYAYPRPGTDQFWREYAEPEEEFLRAAHLLHRAMDGLSQREDPTKLKDGLTLLAMLNDRVAPVLVMNDGSYRMHWASTSLIGSLAMMMTLDLAESRRFARCEVCNSIFVTTSPEARYCSAKHRRTAQQRNYREGRKA